jgi:hypothetical protein
LRERMSTTLSNGSRPHLQCRMNERKW